MQYNRCYEPYKLSQNKRNFIITFKQKVIKETKMTKNIKIINFQALTEEFLKIKAHLITK